jgi:fucose permease
MKTGSGTAPKKGRRMTAVFFILSGLIAATWASRIPDIQKKMELGNAAWGTVLFVSPAGLVCGLLVASWMTAHYGIKKILLASTIISSLLLVLAGFSNEQLQLMIVLFLMGFTRTILNISANTLSIEVQQQFAKPIISTFHGLWSLACFIAASVGTGMIVLNILPRYHFLAIALVCIMVSLLFFRSDIGKQQIKKERKPFFVKPDRYLFFLGMIAFCGMITENAMFDWSVNYFEQVVQPEKGLVTIGYTCFIISMTIGRLTGDRMISMFGPIKLLMGCGLLISTGLILSSLIPHLFIAALGFIIVGLGDSVIVPIVYALAGKTNKMPAGYAISAVTMIGYSGFLTGPLLIGSLSDILGMQWAFMFISIFGLIIFFLARKVREFKELN